MGQNWINLACASCCNTFVLTVLLSLFPGKICTYQRKKYECQSRKKKIETTECFRVFYKAQLSSCLYRICKKSQNVRIKNKSVHDQCNLLKCDQLYSCKKNITNVIMKLYFTYIFLSKLIPIPLYLLLQGHTENHIL